MSPRRWNNVTNPCNMQIEIAWMNAYITLLRMLKLARRRQIVIRVNFMNIFRIVNVYFFYDFLLTIQTKNDEPNNVIFILLCFFFVNSDGMALRTSNGKTSTPHTSTSIWWNYLSMFRWKTCQKRLLRKCSYHVRKLTWKSILNPINKRE